jgi:hypothetical protein
MRLQLRQLRHFRQLRIAGLHGLVVQLLLVGAAFAEPNAAAGRGAVVRAGFELSGYADTDHVTVATPSIVGSIADDVEGWSVGGSYLLDAVSAASVDIVSTASAKWTELRHVGSGSASFKRGDLALSFSGGLSHEPDYLSLGVGGLLSVELMDKNVTPFLGYNYQHDDVGRTGTPKTDWETMHKHGLQLGTTFVVDRSTIASIVGDGIFERGYLAKPYRYIPLFAEGTGADVPVGASVRTVNEMRLGLRPADRLPDARNRLALTGRLAHRFDTATVRLDQRLYGDNWGLRASTTDARYTVDVGRRISLWPHARLHVQNAVDFWKRAYEAIPGPNDTFGLPPYRTGDRELGGLYTFTAGGGIRFVVNSDLRSPMALVLQADAAYTHYGDALYIISRRSIFTALSFEAETN